jgi:hypothetical protein
VLLLVLCDIDVVVGVAVAAATVHGLVVLLVAVPKLIIGALERHDLVLPRKDSALAPADDVGALMQLNAAEWPPVGVLPLPSPTMYCYAANMRRRDVDARGDGRSFCLTEITPLSMATQIAQCYHCFRVAAVIPTMMPVVPAVRVKLVDSDGWLLPVVVMIAACCCDVCC